MHAVGIGKHMSWSAYEAGRQAAESATKALAGARSSLALVFASAALDPNELIRGVESVIQGVPLSGCSGTGVITREGSDEHSHIAAVMAIASDSMTFDACHVDGLGDNASRFAENILAQIRHRGSMRPRLVLAFPDGLTGNVAEFLRVLDEGLPPDVKCAGATAGELLKTDRTWQYHNGGGSKDGVSVALIGGGVTADVEVSQGCNPIGIEQQVTRARNGWIYEIDGVPAWTVYRQYLDVRDDEEFTMSHTCFICLAQLLPEPDPFYGKYVIRCPLRLDRATGALFFPGDIPTGTKVHMALRSPEGLVARAKRSAERIVARHGGARPVVMLHFDCCCRANLLFGSRCTEESIQQVWNAFPSDVPWFGFHSYGEIAPLASGRTHFHNYASVLCALYDAPP